MPDFQISNKPPKKRKRLRFFIAVFFFLVLLVFFDNVFGSILTKVTGDALDWRGRWLMGIRGIDCGTVEIRGNPKVATECALKANAEGKPFRVRYDLQGFDSAVAAGIVRTPAGELYALSFDGNPSGSGGTSLFGQRVGKSPCPKPIHLWVNPAGRINCFQPQLSYPRDIMSPNLEPY